MCLYYVPSLIDECKFKKQKKFSSMSFFLFTWCFGGKLYPWNDTAYKRYLLSLHLRIWFILLWQITHGTSPYIINKLKRKKNGWSVYRRWWQKVLAKLKWYFKNWLYSIPLCIFNTHYILLVNISVALFSHSKIWLLNKDYYACLNDEETFQ